MPFLLSLCLLLASAANMTAAAVSSEQETAAAYLKEQGVMVGDQTGNMNLDKGLTRVELATILTRLNGNPEHVQAEQAYYSGQCKFPDVPDWARLYVGYCYVNGLMIGYDTGAFGAYDGVTPAAASAVVLRYPYRGSIQPGYHLHHHGGHRKWLCRAVQSALSGGSGGGQDRQCASLLPDGCL